MSIIPIRFTLEARTDYTVLINGENMFEHSQHTVEFNTPILKDHKMHTLDICGDVRVVNLTLDGIDTEYFIHHGFTTAGYRGNADPERVRYYFQTPVWEWYIDWKQHDNSKFRNISKTHQGFLPL
jgi:hypothetical protein